MEKDLVVSRECLQGKVEAKWEMEMTVSSLSVYCVIA